MERGTFKILCRGTEGYRTEDRTGYLFDYGKYRFGCNRTNSGWVVTLLSAGIRVNNFRIGKKSDIIQELENHSVFDYLNAIEARFGFEEYEKNNCSCL